MQGWLWAGKHTDLTSAEVASTGALKCAVTTRLMSQAQILSIHSRVARGICTAAHAASLMASALSGSHAGLHAAGKSAVKPK